MEHKERTPPPQEIMDVNGHPLIVGEFYFITKKNRKISDKSLAIPHFRSDYDIRLDDELFYNNKEYPYQIRARYIGKTTNSLKFVQYIPATKTLIHIKNYDFLKYKQGIRDRSSETKFTLEPTGRPFSYTPHLNKEAFDMNENFDFRKQELFKFNDSGVGEIILDENGHPLFMDKDEYEDLSIGYIHNPSIYIPISKIEDEDGIDDSHINTNYYRAQGKTKRHKKTHKRKTKKHKKRKY